MLLRNILILVPHHRKYILKKDMSFTKKDIRERTWEKLYGTREVRLTGATYMEKRAESMKLMGDNMTQWKKPIMQQEHACSCGSERQRSYILLIAPPGRRLPISLYLCV